MRVLDVVDPQVQVDLLRPPVRPVRWNDLAHRLRYVLGEYDDEPALLLSAAFDAERERLLALAAEHGGRDGGWGSLPPEVRP